MAHHQFAPNLDNGEHWLPSDIFANEVVLPSKYNNFSCMEDLATHFATLSLLKNRHSLTPSRPIPKPPLNSQRVNMAVRDHLRTGYLGFNGGGGELRQRLYHGYETGSFLARSEPLYDFQVQPQRVDSYLEETRSRVLQRQRNNIQNRVYPFQGNGFGFGGVRESGGTGVFHPRIVNPRIATSSGGADIKRKQSVRIRQQSEVQVTQQRNSMRRVVLNNQEDCYYHLPPEMGLPQDWTY